LQRWIASLGLALAMSLGPGAPAGAGEPPRARIDPNFPPFRSIAPNTGGVAAPQAIVPRPDDRVRCDGYGRCWQQVPSYGGGYTDGRGARPPGWADDLPRRRSRDPYRFDRPRSGVVCDAATSLCYKQGAIDKSETKAAFGERAADRADDLRDRGGTDRLFVPERGVTCDPRRRVCFDDGVADFSHTRRYFGQRAADAVE
jgi:Fels-1 Prophage Protein-like